MSAVSTDALSRRSVEVLTAGQSSNGAIVACPTFPTYRYSWLRDGSFCARALDVAGERAAAAAFHRWVAASVERHRHLLQSAVERVAAGDEPGAGEMPPARYTLEGTLEPEGDEPWPNFQFDGYGMWLWSLAEHFGGAADPSWRDTVETVARYLRAARTLKSFSCWEEFDDGEHASSLGAAIAGFDAAARLLGSDAWADEGARAREELVARFVRGGRLCRGATDDRVDASLLWLGAPFGVLPLDDPVLAATVDAVRRDLRGPGGGVYRYLGDTYYGGGEWILLACSLGLHEAAAGDRGATDELRAWVRAQANADGELPEQVDTYAQAPERIAEWVARWGPSASPLLWSHAMYLLLEAAAAG